MSQFANYLQFHTRGIKLQQEKEKSRSISIRSDNNNNNNNTSNSPIESKYRKQFMCLNQSRQQHKTNMFPIHEQSSNRKAPSITTKLTSVNKENNHNIYNINYGLQQQCRTPRQQQSQFLQESYVKQTTPKFEQKLPEFNGFNREFILSNHDINIRFVDSQKNTENEDQLQTIADQLNKIHLDLKSNKCSQSSINSEDQIVMIDSVKKNINISTKTIGIQAFESTQFEKQEQQLEKIFGSFKKVKIIRKKSPNSQQTHQTLQTTQTQQTQQNSPTQYTYKTNEDSIIKTEIGNEIQPLKTIHNLSNIEFQSDQFKTEHTDLDSHRQMTIDEQDQNSSYRISALTPRKQQHYKKISFLLYKKQQERQQ